MEVNEALNVNIENETLITEQVMRKSRKRVAQRHLWKRNIKKLKVNSGLSYISAGNKPVPARHIKLACNDKCRLKCRQNVQESDRILLHEKFWKLADNALQRQFVASHMEECKVKYRRVTEGSTRARNLAYFLTVGGSRIRVCKTFFINTLGISDKFTRTTWKKSDGTGLIEKDKRGNLNRREAIDPAIKDAIRKHINAFARIESHYLRSQTTREFIDGSLSISQMYRYYQEEQQNAGLPIAKKNSYEFIFNTEFNISFFTPKKDQCSVCESFKNSGEEEQLNLKESYDRHIENKNLSRKHKADDIARATENPSIIVACYDLQAVLPTPCGDISTYYFKCRLNCLNFTIFEILSKNGFCYFWHEAIARRGANEIASCLLDYLQYNCTEKDVIFYSDNCVGQNKNKFIVSMYIWAVCKCNINSITHKFLTVGHTQNEGDAMHATIEREKKRILRSGPIYVPSQWLPVIRSARKSKPYKVNEMATEEFYDFHDLSQNVGNNFSVNVKGEKVIWNNIQILKVSKDSPGIIFYKNAYNSEAFEEIKVQTVKHGRPSLSAINGVYNLKPAYQKPPTISDKTKSHLMELCKKNLIKKVHHPFFENLNSA